MERKGVLSETIGTGLKYEQMKYEGKRGMEGEDRGEERGNTHFSG